MENNNGVGMTQNETKSKIIELLKSTNRENIDKVVDFMVNGGFFEAAASVVRHNNFAGGLAKHSLDVCREAMKLNEQLEEPLPRNSVIICSLLHDICKYDQYVIKEGKPVSDKVKIAKGHGKRSMHIVKRECCLPLNYDEEMAIWWHMGWHEVSLHEHTKEYNDSRMIPLCELIQKADWIAAGFSADSENQMSVKGIVLGALKYVGADPNDFNLKDGDFTSVEMAHHRKHGMPHLYRVMIAAALIAKELGEPRKGLLAVCAAFIHDLARESNGGHNDRDHGHYAALFCFDKYESVWQKYNLTEWERDVVRAACSNHSSHKEHPFRYDLIVSNILKDADALDRCRFYQHGRLDIEMLKYQRESRSLIPLTTAICQPTNVFLEKEVTFADFIGMID